MNDFVKKYKALFKFYCAALQISGWLLLLSGFSCYGILAVLARNLGTKALSIVAMNLSLNGLIPFGLLGLGTSQLLRYLYDDNYKAGFILRNASKFIFAYLVLVLIMVVIRNVYTAKYLMDKYIENEQILYYSTSAASIVLFAAKALILIGLSQLLKRSLPIIEESKTLV